MANDASDDYALDPGGPDDPAPAAAARNVPVPADGEPAPADVPAGETASVAPVPADGAPAPAAVPAGETASVAPVPADGEPTSVDVPAAGDPASVAPVAAPGDPASAAPAPDPVAALAAVYVPAKAKRVGSPWWAKALVGVGAILMVVAGGGAVYAKLLMDRVNNAGTEKNLLGDGDSRAGEDIEGPLNLLMVGTDMRVNDSDDIDRADSIMILHINEDLTKANIVSIPRDLKVPCNGEPEGSCYTKINGTYQQGGDTQEERFQGLAKSLSKLTGIKEFDGAAIVGFEGFLDAVKVLGSVELCLPMDMQLHIQMQEQPDKPRTFKKGCREYDQQEALWIVRERYAYSTENPDFDPSWGVGDYGRQHMQQHFIKQLLKKAGEEGYITDPTKVGDLIETVGSSLTYHFRGHSPVDMAWALKGVKPDSMKTLRLPSETSVEFGESFEVVPEGEPTKISESLFKALREDTVDEWIADNPDLLNKD